MQEDRLPRPTVALSSRLMFYRNPISAPLCEFVVAISEHACFCGPYHEPRHKVVHRPRWALRGISRTLTDKTAICHLRLFMQQFASYKVYNKWEVNNHARKSAATYI